MTEVTVKGFVGPVVAADGTINAPRLEHSGAQVVQELHGRFFETGYRQNTYYISAAAAAPTAYVGAGAGTPLLAIHNPSTSGRILALLCVGFGHRVGGSAAGATTLAAWAGTSVLPTGTTTTPRNMYTQAQSGASAVGFVNTALTGSTALNLVLPMWGYQIIGATPVSQGESATMIDVGAAVIATPGNQIAIGLTVVPTSMTADVSMIWEEIPV